MKTVVRIVVLASVIAVIIAVAASLFLNSLIERSIETAGSKSLSVDVSLSGADLSLLDGKLTLSNLRISNPQGFDTDRLFSMTNAEATVRPSALLEREIVIDSIFIEAPDLTIEQSMKGTNMGTVLANVEGEQPGAERSGEPRDAGKPGKQKTYRIKMLRITGAKVTFTSFLTSEPVIVPLSDIQMENLTNADGTGILLSQVIEKVLAEMIRTALIEGEGVIPADVTAGVRSDLGRFIPELELDMVEKVRQALERASETLKGLFKE